MGLRGSLISKIWKGFKELETIGLIDGVDSKIYGAQTLGSNAIVDAFKADTLHWLNEVGVIVEPVERNVIE